MKNIDKYKNREARIKYIKEWKHGHKKDCREYLKTWYQKKKRQALLIVGNGKLVCERCGSNDYELLEINHKNGGGYEERKKCGGSGLIRAIVSGKRDTKDLNLLCRPCNLVFAAEKISGRKYTFTL